jgi:hypothetical protein
MLSIQTSLVACGRLVTPINLYVLVGRLIICFYRGVVNVNSVAEGGPAEKELKTSHSP